MPPIPPLHSRWKPGQSGNPAGYSRSRRISDAIEKLLDEDDNLERVAKRWLRAVLSGEDFRYLKELLERTEGKVPDAVQEPSEMSLHVTHDEEFHAAIDRAFPAQPETPAIESPNGHAAPV